MRTVSLKANFIMQSILFAIMLMMVTLSAHAASVNWHSYSNTIFKMAKQENKNILLYGYTKKCPYCARMNQYTFVNSMVADRINKKYIAVKIDTGEESVVADQYSMDIVPTIIIINAQGSIVTSIYGYQSPSEILSKI